MSRLILFGFFFITHSCLSQIDGFFDEPDFVPIQSDGEWVWYNITNDSISDELRFTDFFRPESGYCSSFVLKNDSMWGVMTGTDEVKYPFVYDSIIFSNNHFITLTKNVWNYHLEQYNREDSLISFALDSVYSYEEFIYIYSKGKVGLILPNGEFVAPQYDALHPFNCPYAQSESSYLMSFDGTQYNLLDNDGHELLPEGVWDLRCTEDNVFEYRREKYPEFYYPFTNEHIDPNGNNIVFYGNYGYKIYNSTNTRSELHINARGVLKDQYDDYFPISEKYIVVRKDGKVGLSQNGSDVLGSIEYDQINLITEFGQGDGNSDAYFTFYHGDSCGLLSNMGIELFPAKYANVLQTGDYDRFIVLDDDKAGVVDRQGRTIIPVNFDHVYFDIASNLFVMQQGNLMGLHRRDGSMLVPIEYNKHFVEIDFFNVTPQGPLHVLGKNNLYYFANSKGLLDEKGSDHYDYTGAVLKTYSKSSIKVYALGDEGLVEEVRNYPVYRPTVIENEYFSNWEGLRGWTFSKLEENQEEGYFGLRFYTKRGFGVNPSYRTVRYTCFPGSIYLGEVAYTDDSKLFIEDVSMQVIRSYDMLNTGTGKREHSPLYNSEFQMPYSGSGERRINFEIDGSQVVSPTPRQIFNEVDLSERVHYGDYANELENYRRVYKGGLAEICPIDSATISLFDYYQYWNSIDACRLKPHLMKQILDPKLGVRFVNSELFIFNSTWAEPPPTMRSMDMPTRFDEYDFLSKGLIVHERAVGSETGSLSMKIQRKKDEDEIVVEDVLSATEVEGFVGALVLAEVKSNTMAKIHIDFPDFYFVQDSINLSYNDGRITRRIDSNLVRLITPQGRTVVDSCSMIQYLGENRFAILNEWGWKLMDKDGRPVNEFVYARLGEFTKNRSLSRLKDGREVTINRDGIEVEPLPEAPIFIDEMHYHFASNPADIIDARTGKVDRASDEESYLENGYFISKQNGASKLRRFGSSDFITIRTKALSSFGSRVYYIDGKHLYAIDSLLKVQKHKKVDQFKSVSNEIGWIEGKKDELIDENWGRICVLKSNERFELQKGELVLLQGDSITQNFGSRILTGKDQNKDSLELPEVKIISENGKYGVIRGEDVILPMTYSGLSSINDQEFYTRVESEYQLYNTTLERIGDQPFEWFIQTMSGNFVFYYQGQVFFKGLSEK